MIDFKENKTSKILIICYDFYPENKPNTYRWFNIAKEWVKEGIEVHVITSDKNQYLSYEKVEGINIHRTSEYFVGNLKYKYRETINTNNVANKNTYIDKIKTFSKGVIRKIYNITWSNLYWPDHSFLWSFSAYSLSKDIIKLNNIDKIITVSWTFSAHLVGYKLKKKNNDLFWLADTIDPFSFNGRVNNSFLYSKANFLIEKKVFASANLNSVLTEKIKEKYESMFPNAIGRIRVTNNIYVPENFTYKKNVDALDNVVRIVFLGTLSKSTRPPDNMLKLFNNLINRKVKIKFKVDFYGDLTDTDLTFKKYNMLSDIIQIHGLVDRTEINDIIKKCDVLLNIGNTNEYQEPSKLIEYMYSGKKILNVCTINEDTSAILLKDYPLSLSIFANDLENTVVLDRVAKFLNSTELIDRNKIELLLHNYLLKTIANRYLSYLPKP